MLRNDLFLVYLMCGYLLLYCFLLAFQDSFNYAFAMLLLAPFPLCTMIYSMLRYGKPGKRELGNEEFGYADKQKEKLNVF